MTLWFQEAVWWSTMAVLFGAGCGRVASTEATAPDGAATKTPGPFTSWTPCETLTTDRPQRPPHALVATPDARWLAMLDSPFPQTGELPNDDFQSVALWHLPSTTMVRRITNVLLGFDVDLSPDGALVAITGDGAQVERTSDGQLVWEHPPPQVVPEDNSWVTNFAFSPDGTLLASGREYDVELHRADTGASVAKLVDRAPSSGVAFSPDGVYLASSAPSVWRVRDRAPVWAGSMVGRIPSGVLTDNWATFSPDGTVVLSQSADFRMEGGVREIWNTTTTTVLYTTASGDPARALRHDLPRRPTFSPDGRWVLAGDRLIDVKTGQESPLGAAAAISTFLSDGRIAAADATGTVSLLCPSPP